MRPVLFRWRGRPVHSYPVFLFVALAVGVTVAQAAAVARGLDQAAFLVALLAAVGPALLGTRLLYVATDPGAPWSSVLRPGTGGSVLYGGLLGAGLVSLPVTILLGIPFGLFWDAVVYGMLAGIMVGRLGCLLHGCCVGRRTTGLLAVELSDHRGTRCPRFPVRLAEIAWCFLIIGALFLIERSGALTRPGDIFFAGAGGYAVGRFVLEFGRERRPSFIGPLTVSHAISILLILVSGTVFL